MLSQVLRRLIDIFRVHEAGRSPQVPFLVASPLVLLRSLGC